MAIWELFGPNGHIFSVLCGLLIATSTRWYEVIEASLDFERLVTVDLWINKFNFRILHLFSFFFVLLGLFDFWNCFRRSFVQGLKLSVLVTYCINPSTGSGKLYPAKSVSLRNFFRHRVARVSVSENPRVKIICQIVIMVKLSDMITFGSQHGEWRGVLHRWTFGCDSS